MSSLKPNVRFFGLFGVFLLFLVLLPISSLRAQITCGNVGNTCDTDPECSDGDPCNGAERCVTPGGGVDTLSPPTCQCALALPPDNTVTCTSDNLFCNGTELCVGGTCSGHSGDPCTGGGECADLCNETNDTCNDPSGTTCTDDGNVCTTNECNGSGTCVATNNTEPCDDGTNCTDPDVCSGGVCTGTPITPADCSDGISCTIDACVEATGECASDPGQCECQTDADCDDNNVCTDEFCDLATLTCVRSNNTDPCDDALFCNGPDTCSGGACSQHGGDPCTGGTQCNQICNETGDNCFDPSGTVCEDGDVGTVNECNGQGTCITTGTFIIEGSGLLSCSLRPAEQVRFEAGSLALAIPGLGLALAFRTLVARKRRP